MQNCINIVLKKVKKTLQKHQETQLKRIKINLDHRINYLKTTT